MKLKEGRGTLLKVSKKRSRGGPDKGPPRKRRKIKSSTALTQIIYTHVLSLDIVSHQFCRGGCGVPGAVYSLKPKTQIGTCCDDSEPEPNAMPEVKIEPGTERL